MSAGSRALRLWLDRSSTRRAELADQLSISRPYLSQILHAERRPGLDLLVRIEQRTGVPVVSWSETPLSYVSARPKRPTKKSFVSNELPAARAS